MSSQEQFFIQGDLEPFIIRFFFISLGKQGPNSFLNIGRNKFKLLLRAISSLPLLSYYAYKDTHCPTENRYVFTF